MLSVAYRTLNAMHRISNTHPESNLALPSVTIQMGRDLPKAFLVPNAQPPNISRCSKINRVKHRGLAEAVRPVQDSHIPAKD